MTTFTDTKEQLNSIQQINEVEKWIGLTFPHEYKNHLLLHNGGRCEPNIFGFIENEEPAESCIDWFLAIYDGKYNNLKDYIETYKLNEKRLPIHIIPIAHDPGGNLVCISCGKEDYGYVYFWDHDKEVNYSISGDFDYSNLYLVAKTFNSFLENLMPSLE